MEYFINNAVGQIDIKDSKNILDELVEHLIKNGYSDAYIEGALYAKGFSLKQINDSILKFTT